MNKIAYVYKITNNQNFKSYIGVTRDRSVFTRWNEHINATHELSEDIKSYGIESFSFSVLETREHITNDELFKLESTYIKRYNTIQNGYNKILSHAKPKRANNYTEKAQNALALFAKNTYLGTPLDNCNRRVSFWDAVASPELCFVTLLTHSNYLTRDSKYQKIMHAIFIARNQRFFRIKTQGNDYYTDNLMNVIDFMSILYKEDRNIKYELISSEAEHNGIRVKARLDGVIKSIKIFSPLLFEDEVTYYIHTKDIESLFLDS